jgi:hypothetical protein
LLYLVNNIIISITLANLSQYHSPSASLWDFLASALTKARFLLCTATLTDKALKDIMGENAHETRVKAGY